MLISFIFKSSTLIDAPFNCCNVLVKSIPVILPDVVLYICISHAEHVVLLLCVCWKAECTVWVWQYWSKPQQAITFFSIDIFIIIATEQNRGFVYFEYIIVLILFKLCMFLLFQIRNTVVFIQKPFINHSLYLLSSCLCL